MSNNAVNLQICVAACQAVHHDIEQGLPPASASNDLAKANGYFSSIDGGTPEFTQAQSAVASAMRDYNAYLNNQDKAASAAQGFAGATGVNIPAEVELQEQQNESESRTMDSIVGGVQGFETAVGDGTKKVAGAVGDGIGKAAGFLDSTLALVVLGLLVVAAVVFKVKS